MTNAELISMVRDIAEHGADWRINEVLNCAADALEAAEHRIEDLEGALAACRARKDGRMPKEGEWIDIDGTMFAECSVCGKRHYGCTTPYCDMCGARMKTVTDCHALNEKGRCEQE